MLESLEHKRLVFVTGKGGVGKSTCTAAVAEALRQRGRKVLVIETDAFSAMNELLGVAGTDGERIKIADGLWAINLKTEACLAISLARFVPSDRVVKAITQNRVTKAFFQSAPSVNEFVLLDAILDFLEDVKASYDHVIVDLPASGHAVTFLGVPQTLNKMMRNVGPFAKRAKVVSNWIQDSTRTAIVAVCLPEEMPVNETIELADNLEENVHRSLDLTLVNMVHPRPFPARFGPAFQEATQAEGVADDPTAVFGAPASGTQRVLAGNLLANSWYKRDRIYLDLLHSKLDAEIVELPMVYEIEERDIVARVAQFLNDEDASTENLAS